MHFLIPILEKLGVHGSYPRDIVNNKPSEETIQPTGVLSEPFPHSVQKTSDLGSQSGPPYTPAPKRETNMWGDNDKLPAIIPGLVGGKVGPRPTSETDKPTLPKLEKKALAKGMIDEFNRLTGRG